MIVKFTHYLVTRFNVPIDQWARDKAGNSTLDPKWMEHRLDLFRKYCVPSVAGQSVKNFRWILYCDSLTNELHRSFILEAIKKIPFASIHYAPSHQHMIRDLRHKLSQSGTPYVMTSRLDNDDGLANHFIQTVQAHFKEQDKYLLNLEGGIQYDISREVITYIKGVNNHYSTLIEIQKKEPEFVTVLGFPHNRPPAEIKIENICVGISWLKIIHSRNVKSKLTGVPVFSKRNLSVFGTKKEDLKTSLLNSVIYGAIWLSNGLKRKLKKRRTT